MSLELVEWQKLVGIKEDTRQTVEQLRFLNEKMDKQIALLEKMVEILKERRTDADY